MYGGARRVKEEFGRSPPLGTDLSNLPTSLNHRIDTLLRFKLTG
jgi:hypothetical protein